MTASALIALIGAMLLVQWVGLHWHRHFSTQAAPASVLADVQHLADAATPHTAIDYDQDIKLSGELSAAYDLPALGTLDWGLLLLVMLSVWLPQQRFGRHDPSRRAYAPPPPLPPSHAPPHSA